MCVRITDWTCSFNAPPHKHFLSTVFVISISDQIKCVYNYLHHVLWRVKIFSRHLESAILESVLNGNVVFWYKIQHRFSTLSSLAHIYIYTYLQLFMKNHVECMKFDFFVCTFIVLIAWDIYYCTRLCFSSQWNILKHILHNITTSKWF